MLTRMPSSGLAAWRPSSPSLIADIDCKQHKRDWNAQQRPKSMPSAQACWNQENQTSEFNQHPCQATVDRGFVLAQVGKNQRRCANYLFEGVAFRTLYGTLWPPYPQGTRSLITSKTGKAKASIWALIVVHSHHLAGWTQRFRQQTVEANGTNKRDIMEESLWRCAK